MMTSIKATPPSAQRYRLKHITIRREISPLEFCAEWLELTDIERSQLFHSTDGFRSRCNYALSEALGVTISSPKHWGTHFERMPVKYRQRLAHALLHKQMMRLITFEKDPAHLISFAIA